MAMGMYFNVDVNMTNILFKGWNTGSIKDVLLAAFIALLLTVLFEGLKAIKQYVIVRRNESPLTYGNHDNQGPGDGLDHSSSQADLLSSLRIPASMELIYRKKAFLFSLESLLQLITFFYGYILMLLVMTYSVWFLVPVILGSGLGYFIFNPIIQFLSTKYAAPPRKKMSSHCHGSEHQQGHGEGSVNSYHLGIENQESEGLTRPTANYGAIPPPSPNIM